MIILQWITCHVRLKRAAQVDLRGKWSHALKSQTTKIAFSDGSAPVKSAPSYKGIYVAIGASSWDKMLLWAQIAPNLAGYWLEVLNM